MSYDAFISYKHSSELPLATALDDGLARFAKPWHKLRARRVYRDLDSQALTPNLLAAVQSAMDASEYLILLASPESAASPWVPAEVEYWIANRPLDRLLIVVCAGTVAWDNAAGDFDWEATDCLPQCLRGRYQSQPLYLDLRWARGSASWDSKTHLSRRRLLGYRQRLEACPGRHAGRGGAAVSPCHAHPQCGHRRALQLVRGSIGVRGAGGAGAEPGGAPA